MQLPPTILSLDDKKKDKKSTSHSQGSIKPTVPSLEKPHTNTGNFNEVLDSESSSSEGDLPDGVAEKSIPSQSLVPKLVPPRTLQTTLFDRLEKMYGSRIKKMLEIQYRYVPKRVHIGAIFLNMPAI